MDKKSDWADLSVVGDAGDDVLLEQHDVRRLQAKVLIRLEERLRLTLGGLGRHYIPAL